MECSNYDSVINSFDLFCYEQMLRKIIFINICKVQKFSSAIYISMPDIFLFAMKGFILYLDNLLN